MKKFNSYSQKTDHMSAKNITTAASDSPVKELQNDMQIAMVNTQIKQRIKAIKFGRLTKFLKNSLSRKNTNKTCINMYKNMSKFEQN